MKRLTTGLIALALLGACSSMGVQTDFSQEADFSEFKTFRYEDSRSSLTSASPLTHERIVAAIRREMVAAGLTETDSNPDVAVTYAASVDQQVQFNTTYASMGGWGRYGRGGVGVSSSSTRATTFDEGTLVIDIFRIEGNQLVWRSIITDTLSSNTERNREMLNRGVARAFEAFPPS
jgi:hypothetical protein